MLSSWVDLLLAGDAGLVPEQADFVEATSPSSRMKPVCGPRSLLQL